MTRLVVGPFNRVEGDLEVKLDISEGQVVDAWVTAPMYRGFEQILEGKTPGDALVIAPGFAASVRFPNRWRRRGRWPTPWILPRLPTDAWRPIWWRRRRTFPTICRISICSSCPTLPARFMRNGLGMTKPPSASPRSRGGLATVPVGPQPAFACHRHFGREMAAQPRHSTRRNHQGGGSRRTGAASRRGFGNQAVFGAGGVRRFLGGRFSA